MGNSRRGYIVATCFLSSAAAIISIVSLITKDWVTSKARSSIQESSDHVKDYVRFGLFGGIFKQTSSVDITFELTMVCLFGKNICALLCGNNMHENLKKLYNFQAISTEDQKSCITFSSDRDSSILGIYEDIFRRAGGTNQDRVFINAAIWLSTVFFLCLSIAVGVASVGLSAWNVIYKLQQNRLNVCGLYLYHAAAFFSVLLSIVLWGAMFAKDLVVNDLPTYKTFLEEFSTRGYSQLGYSYWINVVSLVLYLTSLILLYVRSYLMSKDPPNVPETNAEPLMYYSANRRFNN